MIWVIGGLTLLLLGAAGGLIYMQAKAPPKALIGVTAAGLIAVVTYGVTSDSNVGVAINPATGSVTTTINGVGVDPSNGSVVVGGINTGSGMPVIGIPLDEDEYLDDRKRKQGRAALEAAGIAARDADLEAPAGFKSKTVDALLVEPKPGETSAQALERVQRALQAAEIETTRFEPAGAGGLTGRLSR